MPEDLSQDARRLLQQRNSGALATHSIATNLSSEAKRKYLEVHPTAAQWANFGDFSMMELSPVACYFIGGFGKMGWLKPDRL